MDLNIKEHLTLDEQIQEWYCSNNEELQKLSKYLQEKLESLKETINDAAYSSGYDTGYNYGMDLMIISKGG